MKTFTKKANGKIFVGGIFTDFNYLHQSTSEQNSAT